MICRKQRVIFENVYVCTCDLLLLKFTLFRVALKGELCWLYNMYYLWFFQNQKICNIGRIVHQKSKTVKERREIRRRRSKLFSCTNTQVLDI